MGRFKLTIQYDGSRYDGWQRQGNTGNTIQGKLEEVFSRMTGDTVEIQGAGRTDGGVHAAGQVATLSLPEEFSPEDILAYANRYLPEDIAVTAAERVPERFHARLSAKGKVYRYAIRLGAVPDVFRRKYMWHLPEPLDIAAMEQAAGYLTGTHDYRAFCSNRRYKKSTVRTVSAIEITRQGDDLYLTFRGDGFLYNMVRILTGTLVEVGLGQRKAEEMPAILASRERTAAGKTAPAQGLCLMEVVY